MAAPDPKHELLSAHVNLRLVFWREKLQMGMVDTALAGSDRQDRAIIREKLKIRRFLALPALIAHFDNSLLMSVQPGS